VYVTAIMETEPEELATTCSTSGTAVIAWDSGALICSSTTSGLAPGSVVITVVCGSSIDGMSSCLRLVIE